MTIQDAQLKLALTGDDENLVPIPSHHKPLRASPGMGSASPGYVPDDDEKKYQAYKSEMKAHEPVFVEHEPMFGKEHQRWMRPYRQAVPYPYRFKWDAGWLFVAFLACGGAVYPLLLVLAVFIGLIRCAVWCCFRFPLTSYFFVSLIRALIGGRRRRRRW